MPDLPTIPINNSYKSSRERKIVSNISQNKVSVGGDVALHQGDDGVRISLSTKYKRDIVGLEHAEFDFTGSHCVNQVVTITNTDLTAHPELSNSLGTWRCYKDVPSKTYSDAVIAEFGSGKYPEYERTTGVIYYPYTPSSSYWLPFVGNSSSGGTYPVWL